MTRHQLIMPELGIDEKPIRLSLWLVRPGERVAREDPLVEVLAGPATVDLPAGADGVLLQTLVEEDEPLQVGQTLAVIESA